MKSFAPYLLFILICSSWTTRAEAKRCHNKSAQEELCYTSFNEIHPTQFVLGKLSIKSKIEKIEKLAKKGKIQKYLKQKYAPAVIGPDGLFYITDRHHTSFSIFNSKLSNKYKKVYIKVIQNWSQLGTQEFSTKMIANHYTWLRDENHKLRNFQELPKHINNLRDDPYRSLAWLVRKNNGFNKIRVSFQEFYWGMFFKEQGIKLNSSSAEAVSSVLKKALKLAKSPLASHLPGYKNK